MEYASGARIVHTCKFLNMKTKGLVAVLKTQNGHTEMSGVIVPNAI